MNYMIWNSRGTGSQSFPSLVRELKKYYKLDFLAIFETRSNAVKADRRIRQLGFSKYSFTAADGYSGGIWCLWEEVSMRVEVMKQHKQFMHLQITNSKQEKWFLTVVYASPNRVYRRTLWSELFDIKDSMSGPWCIGGDFNATILAEERRSSALSKTLADSEFIRWIDDMNLADLGFEGPSFTWKKGSRVCQTQLDRFLANEAWCTKFLDAKILHLPHYKSDH